MENAAVIFAEEEERKNELSEFLINTGLIFKFKHIMTISFGLVFFILNLIGVYPSPSMLLIIIFSFSIPEFIGSFFLKRIKNISKASALYFILQIIELIFILIIVHLAGATPFLGAFAIMVNFFVSYFVYAKRRHYQIGFFIVCVLFYVATILLEFFGVLKLEDFFDTGINFQNNFGMLKVAIIPLVLLMLLVFFIVDFFSKRLQESIKKLHQKEYELKQSKDFFKIKVKVRTKELRELNENLDEQVKNKTKELNGRVEELKKINKLMIGREIRMVELKKEIEALKKVNNN